MRSERESDAGGSGDLCMGCARYVCARVCVCACVCVKPLSSSQSPCVCVCVCVFAQSARRSRWGRLACSGDRAHERLCSSYQFSTSEWMFRQILALVRMEGRGDAAWGPGGVQTQTSSSSARVWRRERTERWDRHEEGDGGQMRKRRGGGVREREGERWRPTPALSGSRLIYRLSNAHWRTKPRVPPLRLAVIPPTDQDYPGLTVVDPSGHREHTLTLAGDPVTTLLLLLLLLLLPPASLVITAQTKHTFGPDGGDCNPDWCNVTSEPMDVQWRYVLIPMRFPLSLPFLLFLLHLLHLPVLASWINSFMRLLVGGACVTQCGRAVRGRAERARAAAGCRTGSQVLLNS